MSKLCMDWRVFSRLCWCANNLLSTVLVTVLELLVIVGTRISSQRASIHVLGVFQRVCLYRVVKCMPSQCFCIVTSPYVVKARCCPRSTNGLHHEPVGSHGDGHWTAMPALLCVTVIFSRLCHSVTSHNNNKGEISLSVLRYIFSSASTLSTQTTGLMSASLV